MRILQVTPYFPPAWAYGGPPRVMHAYATGLARRGHEVTVVTTDVLDAARRATPRVEARDGVRVLRLRNVSNTLAWRTKKYLPPGLPAALLSEVPRADVVHVTDARTLLTAAAFLTARRRGVPFCLSPHGSLPGSPGLRGIVKGAYDRALVRPMLERAALLLAQTEHERELLRAAGGRAAAIRRLPLPLDLAEAEGASHEDFRRRFDLSAEAKLLLFLGRIHRLKGLDLLLEAVEPLLAEDESLAVVVVGRDDGAWPRIAARFSTLIAGGRLRMLGPLYGNERFAAYAAADVFCLTPRHWEETSLAALEAAAVGTPVVLSEQAEIPGLNEAGGGFVVPLAAPAIREAVRTTLRRRAEMGAAARELVRRQHASEEVVGRLEGYLEDVVRRSSA